MKRIALISLMLLTSTSYAADWKAVGLDVDNQRATLVNLATRSDGRFWMAKVNGNPQSDWDLVLRYVKVVCGRDYDFQILQEKYYLLGKQIMAPQPDQTTKNWADIEWEYYDDYYGFCDKKMKTLGTFKAKNPNELSTKVIKHLKAQKKATNDPFL